MFNAGLTNIIPVLGYVHTPAHEMWPFPKDLPCYTIFWGGRDSTGHEALERDWRQM